MIITNNRKRVLRINKVLVKPGVNTLNKDQSANIMKEAEHIEDLIENGVLTIPEFDSASDFEASAVNENEEVVESTFDKLNAKDTITVIKGTFDKEKLEEFYDAESSRDEPRKSVISAIEKQIDVIVEAGTKKEDE